MRMGELVLRRLSREPGSPDYAAGRSEWTVDSALDRLRDLIPDFDERIRGKEVLDYGCGSGYQTLALALSGAKRVIGFDTNPRVLEEARRTIDNNIESPNTGRIELVSSLSEGYAGSVDIIVCQNSMEHFVDPAAELRQMRAVLKPLSGQILMTFSPPWLAPYGAHMHFFTRVPWVHLLFSERTVLAVRSQFRRDGACKYEDVEGGLGKLTIRRFEELLLNSGLEVDFLKYDCVKGIHALASIPFVREFFINRVRCILTVPRGEAALRR